MAAEPDLTLPDHLTTPEPGSAADASTKLAEAIDDFLGDLERKFKGISDEVMTKLDDMAERCDRLEQEMLLKEASTVESTGKENTTITDGADSGK